MNTLLFLLAVTIAQSNPEFPYSAFSMKSYPEPVRPGDTVYFMVTAKNPYAKPIYIRDVFHATDIDIQTRLKDSEGQEQPLLFETESGIEFLRISNTVEIKPGDSRIISALAINIPPLEDLGEPFWEKHLKKLSNIGENYLLCVTVLARPMADRERGSDYKNYLMLPLETPLEIKLRSDNEMVLMRKWYETARGDLPALKRTHKVGWTGFGRERIMPKNTIIMNEKFSHWYFVRIGNRYPGVPNVPETWQGWKELEESITPSTMRDEIRLTRILIQYCDTKDDAVLKELKDWFTGMNEIQRTVMAKNICDRMWESRGTDLLESFKKIYSAIKEYDIAAKPERMKKYLEDFFAESVMEIRPWRFIWGTNEIMAKFISGDENTILLERENGRTMSAAVSLLSSADQEYVKQLTIEEQSKP